MWTGQVAGSLFFLKVVLFVINQITVRRLKYVNVANRNPSRNQCWLPWYFAEKTVAHYQAVFVGVDGGFIGFVAEVQDCIVSWCNAFRLGIFFTDGVAAHGEALGAEAVEEELGLHVYSCQDHVGGVICCVLAPVDAGTGVGENNDSLFFAFLQHGDGALHAFMI